MPSDVMIALTGIALAFAVGFAYCSVSGAVLTE